MTDEYAIIVVIVGIIFGFLASVMAFVITYNEYARHFPGTDKPRKLALEAAFFTFVVFLTVAALSGYFLARYVTIAF